MFLKCLAKAKRNKAPGASGTQIETYQHSHTLRVMLYDVLRDIWISESFNEEYVKGVFVMLFKKGCPKSYGNYRPVCLLEQEYKLMAMIMIRMMGCETEKWLPEVQAGFRKNRGCRDQTLTLGGRARSRRPC